MSTSNRERRKAKQKVREQQQRRRQARLDAGPPPPIGPDAVLTSAVVAKRQDNAADLEFCLGLLASRLDRRLVDVTVMRTLDHDVERAWRHGWQPADLVRVVRRLLGRPHHVRMAVDAIAAQMRRYAPATVDERWAAQLQEQDATVWWSSNDEYLAAWGLREGMDREAVLGCVVDLLSVLESLPVLPKLCPLPGVAHRRVAHHPVDQRMLDRVRALLAKAESTSFPEEAEAYTAKAQELMARHSIDHALLAMDGASTDEPSGVRVGVDNPYEAPKVMLLEAVAAANRCRAVWTSELGFSTVVGYPGDVEMVQLLYTSLLVQATAAMVHAGSRRDVLGRSRTRSFRQSFLTAYAHRIGERLTAATEQVSRQATADDDRLLPVLAARDGSVRAAVESMFPQVSFRTVGRAMDREGWASGTAAADLASLTVGHELPD